MEKRCIFCQIVARELPATIIEENDQVMVIEDIHPQAPIHYLIIPKKHVVDIHSLEVADKEMAGELLMMAQKLSTEPKASQFKLISNNGRKAGQVVFHIHLHFLSGY